MNHTTHNESIIDQFTKQAIPFSQKSQLSSDEILDLMVDTCGATVRYARGHQTRSPSDAASQIQNAAIGFQVHLVDDDVCHRSAIPRFGIARRDHGADVFRITTEIELFGKRAAWVRFIAVESVAGDCAVGAHRFNSRILRATFLSEHVRNRRIRSASACLG